MGSPKRLHRQIKTENPKEKSIFAKRLNFSENCENYRPSC